MIYKFIDISCRISKEDANRFLKELGLEFNVTHREKRMRKAWKKKHRHDEPAPIADVFGCEKRIDCVRYTRYDTGRPVFGKDGIKNASISMLASDLMQAGYVLVDAKIKRKEGKYGKQSFNLRFHFEPNATDPFQATAECQTKMKEILAQSWMHAHVWENPDTSSTINVGGAFSANETRPQPLHIVHMNDCGQFSTDPAHETNNL